MWPNLLLALIGPARQIEKTRYTIEHAGHAWDVDVFGGANKGLILAEVELKSPDEAVSLPPWIGSEVTGDPRFRNSKLIPCRLSNFCQPASNPVSMWDPGIRRCQSAI